MRIDGQTKEARVRLIRNPDGSYRVEQVDDIPVSIAIVSPGSADNRPPVFISQPENMRAAVVAGLPYLDTVRAADPDGDTVTLKLLVNPAGMTSSGGAIAWTPAASDSGTHTVSVTANDGVGGIDTLSWTIRVKSASSVNHAPLFSSRPADMTGLTTVGSLYLDTVHATDLDNDTIGFVFMDSVAGMLIRDGIIAWTPADGDTGTRPVSVVAKDGRGGIDTLQWNINVLSGIDTNFVYPKAGS